MKKIDKKRKCSVCEKEFVMMESTTKVCSISCALTYAREKNEAKEKKEVKAEIRKLKINLKTRSQWLRETQTEFNKYIRLRDRDRPCISCGRHHNGQYHAGHYRSVGACPELRFNENNCQKQCQPCNNHLSGNIVEYRLNLINRIGQQAVDDLESHHPPRKYTIDEIKELKRHYRAMAKGLT